MYEYSYSQKRAMVRLRKLINNTPITRNNVHILFDLTKRTERFSADYWEIRRENINATKTVITNQEFDKCLAFPI